MFVADQFEPEFIQGYVQDLFHMRAVEMCICGWLEYFQDNVEASLCLVERRKNGMALPFRVESINKIYQLTNG